MFPHAEKGCESLSQQESGGIVLKAQCKCFLSNTYSWKQPRGSTYLAPLGSHSTKSWIYGLATLFSTPYLNSGCRCSGRLLVATHMLCRITGCGCCYCCFWWWWWVGDGNIVVVVVEDHWLHKWAQSRSTWPLDCWSTLQQSLAGQWLEIYRGYILKLSFSSWR